LELGRDLVTVADIAVDGGSGEDGNHDGDADDRAAKGGKSSAESHRASGGAGGCKGCASIYADGTCRDQAATNFEHGATGAREARLQGAAFLFNFPRIVSRDDRLALKIDERRRFDRERDGSVIGERHDIFVPIRLALP